MAKAKTMKMVDDKKFVKLLALVKESHAVQLSDHIFTVEVPVDVQVSFCSEMSGAEACVDDVDTGIYDKAEHLAENLPEVKKVIDRLNELEEKIGTLASELEARYYDDDDEWDVDEIIELAIQIIVEVEEEEPSARKYKRKYPTVFGKKK